MNYKAVCTMSLVYTSYGIAVTRSLIEGHQPSRFTLTNIITVTVTYCTGTVEPR